MEIHSVPFGDLYKQYESLRGEIDEAIALVIRDSSFIRGPHVENFEAAFAEAIGVPHCVSCANGTDALYIAMRALGVGSGDEVITTAHSWIATSESISQCGAQVVFCDTTPDTYNIDPSAIEAQITGRTVGIIPVHMCGQPADMDAIMQIARRHGLWVIEDCAQAHLAQVHGDRVGTIGTVGTFSFYPGKNLGAMGDAGAITTRDADLAKRMAMFARHGGLTKGDHQIEGINSRLDGIQAAVLSVKLPRLAEWTRVRQEIAEEYNAALSHIEGIDTPKVIDGANHVYHLYMIKHDDRDGLRQFLAGKGVQAQINYPLALPFLPAYAHLGHRPQDFPNAFHNQSRILSLPLYPEMTRPQSAAVVAAVKGFTQNRQSVA